jgi:hypothetical protein
VLEPLMKAVKALEGESYVTTSWVPWLLSDIQHTLRSALEDAEGDDLLTDAVNRLYIDFKKRFCEYEHLSIPKLVQFASALDPRTKAFEYLPLHEEEHLWSEMSMKLVSKYEEEYRKKNENGALATGTQGTQTAPPLESCTVAQKEDVFASIRRPRTSSTFLFVDHYAAEKDHYVD